MRELGQDLEGVRIGPVQVVEEQHAGPERGDRRVHHRGAAATEREPARPLQGEVRHPAERLDGAAEGGSVTELGAHRVQDRRLPNSCLPDEDAGRPPGDQVEDRPDLLVAAYEHGLGRYPPP